MLDDLTLKDMETRLANWLLKQCPRPIGTQSVEIKLDRTKRVLAAEMGTTSETLSRTLAKFRNQKFLRERQHRCGDAAAGTAKVVAAKIWASCDLRQG